MFYNKPNGFRSSVRRPIQRNRFHRPASTGGFNRSNSRYGGGAHESKLKGRVDIFIKAAKEPTTQVNNTIQKNFSDFNLVPTLKINIQNKGYTSLTPIQAQSIEPILEGKDLVGTANTGTGKTAAFLIPLINNIFNDRNKAALIITPTRELAVQINAELISLTQNMQIYSATLIGGSNMYRQINDLRRNPNVVIGTPGRLKDLIQKRILNLQNFSIFVLDEVDLMVDIGFINDIKFFCTLLPQVRQSLFFSATISSKIREILQAFVKNPVTVSVKMQDTSENVDQNIVRVINRDKKVDQLHDLLTTEGFDKVLIFGKTKHGIEKLNQELEFRGFKVGALHGNKKQSQRKRILDSFKQNQIQILLATDVASRGLDIDNVTHVINFDLPQTYDDYVHRIGRTGRSGKAGVALTFID